MTKTRIYHCWLNKDPIRLEIGMWANVNGGDDAWRTAAGEIAGRLFGRHVELIRESGWSGIPIGQPFAAESSMGRMDFIAFPEPER